MGGSVPNSDCSPHDWRRVPSSLMAKPELVRWCLPAAYGLEPWKPKSQFNGSNAFVCDVLFSAHVPCVPRKLRVIGQRRSPDVPAHTSSSPPPTPSCPSASGQPAPPRALARGCTCCSPPSGHGPRPGFPAAMPEDEDGASKF
jgi:hypothetical protein